METITPGVKEAAKTEKMRDGNWVLWVLAVALLLAMFLTIIGGKYPERSKHGYGAEQINQSSGMTPFNSMG